MKKSRKHKRLNKKKDGKPEKGQKFRLSATSGHLIPLQTIRQRIKGIWQSLTWPICVKILKANIAVTIALALLLIDPVRNVSSTGGILASVAVEFVHPAKSYGFLAEDILLGSVMCCISGSWAILGTYLASLVRDPNDLTMAQPDVCAILSCFLVVGCFFLSMFRVKVEQANVGGMLSASIMVISLTSAVTHREFTATTTLQVLVPTLVGFMLIFTIFLLVFPENSTRVFVQDLIRVFESFDGILQRQVNAFIRVNGGPSVSLDQTESLATIHQTVDALITNLIQKKRMVRREPSFNAIAPTDVSEMTSLIKKLRVPIQGLGLSRAMEENMRKAEKSVFQATPLETMDASQHQEGGEQEQCPLATDDEAQQQDEANLPPPFARPRSYYGGTDDEEDESSNDEAAVTTDDDASTYSVSQTPSTANTSSTSLVSDNTTSPRRRKVRWDDHMKVMSYWREDYDDVLNIVKPTYLELTDACSLAVQESVKRLRRLQNLDPRYQDRPFFYEWYYKWKVGSKQASEEALANEYNRLHDPSVPLFEAMARFHQHRLVGLERLYTKSGVPRRILFLLLTFQFNLHSYAEHIYTLTSLIYELDQTRTKRRFWMPHISLRKWFFQERSVEGALDSPNATADTINPTSLQRSMSRRATMIAAAAATSPTAVVDLEAQKVLYKLDTPHRGQVHSPSEHHERHPYDFAEKRRTSQNISPWRQNTLDPLEYHDPDVAYPTTSTQRFFYSVYLFCIKYLYTADVAFSFRAAIVVALLSLPGFLEDSVMWYNEVRGQWAVVVALIWMGPSVGSNFFGTMTRTIGTFIGAIEAMIIWEISRGSVPGLIILTFICNLPWWMIYIHGKFWKATGLFSMITISLIVGYAYSYKPNGYPVSVFVITWERTVDVLVGVFAALLISVFPFPRTGRVVLRHRISQTLSELGALYSSFLALLLKNNVEDINVVEANKKMFRSVAGSIRRQIKGERVLLEQSRFEPALRGIFPEDKYLHILQILDNILSLMLEMEFAFEKIPYTWRMMIVKDTWKERKAMIASFLTTLHLGSNALTSKAPLPPYVMRPTKARRELTNKARKSLALRYQHLGDREYTYFSTYLMNSEQLAVELELLIATIRDLVGPDSVSVWLNYKH
ncbi:hypothetical protein MAM1_0204d07943 [Mucor ambiguus]|uniref:ER transporter 6TM N-terminal domain-containing protein n=1 Tax=Mucor ambiguus TaxID=91626 RepID=A0A0C9MXV7_9FUNG|nr:hypothetical protein MAM1_0204d07943 [Mucor ambiguus]